MAKLIWMQEHSLIFHCPGCGFAHRFRVKAVESEPGAPVWSWNENMDLPTFTPSLMYGIDGKTECHLFVRDGKIVFLNDCAHKLAGQTIEMGDV